MKYINYLFTFSLLAIFACKSSQPITVAGYQYDASHPRKLSIVQGDEIYFLDEDYNAISLERKPFRIEFINQSYNQAGNQLYAAKVAGFSSPKPMAELTSGLNADQVSYFQRGTGLAGPYEGGYLFLDEEFAHHYLYFTRDEYNRCELIREGEDGELHLGYTINLLDIAGESIPIQKTKLGNLYLSIHVDRDLDNIIDKDEFARVNIQFN